MDDKDHSTLKSLEEGDASSPALLRGEDLPTETISLSDMFSKDVTASGSFDIRGGIRASTFGKLLQALPIPALLIDHDHHVVVTNQAWSKLSSEYERMHGAPFSRLFPDQDAVEKAESIVKEVFSSRKPQVTEAVLDVEHKRIWGRMTFRSIRIMEERFVLVLVEDLTVERQLLRLGREYQEELEKRVERRTAELRKMNAKLSREIAARKGLEDQLRQAVKMEALGRLASGVAHDFNNLLGVISGNSQLLLGKMDEQDARRDLVHEITNAVGRAELVTRQLLTFGRGQDTNLRMVDLNAIIADFESMLRRLVGQNIEVSTALDPLLGKVHADPTHIEQVLMNLAVNARDAMPQGGNIIMETKNVGLDEEYCQANRGVTPGQYAMLAVSDTGDGMDKDVMDRIFEPFYTTKVSGEGTGLGLAVVFGIVQNHEGHITCRSQRGTGTRFEIYLPVMNATS
jgi:signal transduction histidine kinase